MASPRPEPIETHWSRDRANAIRRDGNLINVQKRPNLEAGGPIRKAASAGYDRPPHNTDLVSSTKQPCSDLNDRVHQTIFSDGRGASTCCTHSRLGRSSFWHPRSIAQQVAARRCRHSARTTGVANHTRSNVLPGYRNLIEPTGNSVGRNAYRNTDSRGLRPPIYRLHRSAQEAGFTQKQPRAVRCLPMTVHVTDDPAKEYKGTRSDPDQGRDIIEHHAHSPIDNPTLTRKHRRRLPPH